MNHKGFGAVSDETEEVSYNGINHLLIIGINKYADKHITNLNNAVDDAKEVRKVLTEKYKFDDEFVVELYDENATRKNIYHAFRELRGKIEIEVDNLLVYYSGHGHFDKHINLGYWMPADAVHNDEASYIENSSIVNSFIRPLSTKHTLLVSDACFSGSIFMHGVSRKMGFDPADELYKRKSRWALCSGRHNEEVHDGDAGKNSPFASSFLEFLSESKEDKINVSKVIDYVIEATASKYRQLPEGNPIFNVGHKGGQFVFQRRNENGSSIAKKSTSVDVDERELKLWLRVSDEYTALSLLEYIDSYPAGKYFKEAISTLKALIEKSKWSSVESVDTIDAYTSYLKEYPHGKFVEIAKGIIQQRKNKTSSELWEDVLESNTNTEFRKYLSESPESKPLEEAKEIAVELDNQSKSDEKKIILNQVRNAISHGNTTKAIEHLFEYSRENNKEDLENDLILLSSRLNRVNRENNLGIVPTSDYSIRLNQINATLLELMSRINE